MKLLKKAKEDRHPIILLRKNPFGCFMALIKCNVPFVLVERKSLWLI